MEIQALGGLWNISLQIFYENAFPIWDVLGCTFPTTYVTYFSRTLYIPTQGSVRTLSHHQYSPRDALKVLKFNPSLANMRVIKKGKCQWTNSLCSRKGDLAQILSFPRGGLMLKAGARNKMLDLPYTTFPPSDFPRQYWLIVLTIILLWLARVYLIWLGTKCFCVWEFLWAIERVSGVKW